MPTPILVSDALVAISFGTNKQLGASPVPAAPTSAYECQARSVSVSIESRTVDATTICSDNEEPLETRTGGTLNLELYVDKTTGPIFLQKTGYLCSVKVTLGTTGGSVHTYSGLVTNAGTTLTRDGDIQVETATIQLGGFANTNAPVA